MKPTQQALTDWAIRQIKEKYQQDIALLIAIPGHSMDNDCHGECFDYFVPANEKGIRLARTFIIDGVGHDLYPRSWDRLENMANFNDDFTNGLADAIILYYRNEKDMEKFVAMQDKLKANLQDTSFMLQKALEKLDTAMDIYRTMMFEETLYMVRMAAGFIARYLSLAVACINKTYFRERLELETVELAKMKEIPEDFITRYETLVTAKSVAELKNLCYEMIKTTRQFIAAHKPAESERANTSDFSSLAGWYEELSLTWRRIGFHCDRQNHQRVFADAVNLQHELNIMKEEFALDEMDLLGQFDPENLGALKQRAKDLEQYIILEIKNHGAVLNQYNTLEQFLAHHS